jgi:glycosyltransferase involved in cell wall biosynthesis
MARVDMIPEVTVIIPCGGHHSLMVDSAVLSCLSATPPPDRVIVIDDWSAPPVNLTGIKSAVPIGLWRLDKHRGRSEARNAAAKLATTEWLFFLDADDTLEPTAIADFRDLVAEQPVDIAFADYDYLDEEGGRVRVEKRPYDRATTPIDNAVNIGMFVRRQRFELLGGFDEDMAIGEYWDLFLRYTANPDVAIVKHDRPFFLAGRDTSVVDKPTERMAMATEKIEAMIKGGYYRAGRWESVPLCRRNEGEV